MVYTVRYPRFDLIPEWPPFSHASIHIVVRGFLISLQLMFTFYSLLRQCLRYRAPALFVAINLVTALVWFFVIGRRAWEPAWPFPRTCLILALFSSTVWFLLITALLLLSYILSSERRHLDHKVSPLEDTLELELGRSDTFPARLPSVGRRPLPKTSFWVSWRQLPFKFGFVISALLWVTYENAANSRFKADVRAAVRFPKSKGYGNGGANYKMLLNDNIYLRFSERIFIAAIFHNNEKVVPYWGHQIIRAIHYLGTVCTLTVLWFLQLTQK